MATIAVDHKFIAKGVMKSSWGAQTVTTDTVPALDAPTYPEKSVQVIGTYDGATITIQGSNDAGTTYDTLNDSRGVGNAMTFTSGSGGVKTLLENPQLVKPKLTTSTGSPSLKVIIISRAAYM